MQETWVRSQPEMQETRVQSLGQEDPLEKDMATHSSTLAWKVPRTEEPGGLQSGGRKESDTTDNNSCLVAEQQQRKNLFYEISTRFREI